MNRVARGSLLKHGAEDDINFLTARKWSPNEKAVTVIRFFVMNLIKPWKGQGNSTDKRNRYCTYSD
jgi:hypothetical protein